MIVNKVYGILIITESFFTKYTLVPNMQISIPEFITV